PRLAPSPTPRPTARVSPRCPYCWPFALLTSSASVARRRRGALVFARDDAGFHRKLVRGEPQRLARDVLAHAGHLEEHAAGLHHRPPVVRRALTLAHARLRRLRRHRLVREDADPYLATALDVVRDRAAGGLDLTGVDPGGAQRLQPELAERHLGAGVGGS